MKSMRLFPLFMLLAASTFAQRSSDGGYTEYADLLYVEGAAIADDSLQRLNLVLPIEGQNTPLLVWIGGGAWAYGDRQVEMDLARQFAQAGIAVASVGHRLSPAIWRDSALNTGVQHPKHIEDVAAAVKWLYDHAEKYGYSPEKFFIGGFSSGAHLAALLCMDSTYLTQVGLSPSLMKGMIPISGTYDLEHYHSVFLNGSRPELAELHVEAVFGPVEGLQSVSPVHYLAYLATPMLLMSDNNVYNYSRLFEERIRETDFREVQVVYAYHLSHAELWRDMSFSDQSVYRDVMVAFIWAQLEEA